MSRLPPYYGAASDLDWRAVQYDEEPPTCVDCDQPTTDPGRLCPTCREACGAVDDGPMAVDEALARFNLGGPAGGALVGQPMPTESTGPFTDEYAVETLTRLARTLPEVDEQHSCLRGALAIKAIAARSQGVGRAVSKTVCENCGAADFYTCGCYDHCSCGHDRRSHTASGICTHLGCGCHSGLHGSAAISAPPPQRPAAASETPDDFCENCGAVFDDTARKFITWDDIELCERCHQEVPKNRQREEPRS